MITTRQTDKCLFITGNIRLIAATGCLKEGWKYLNECSYHIGLRAGGSVWHKEAELSDNTLEAVINVTVRKPVTKIILYGDDMTELWEVEICASCRNVTRHEVVLQFLTGDK